MKTIEGIVVKLKKKGTGTKSEVPQQRITGIVTRNGKPVKTGWVGLWALAGTPNAANAFIMRGRTVSGDPIVYASTPITDGTYSLDVPFQDKGWYVVVEEPGQPLNQVGPISIALNQEKKLDVSCEPGGSVSGRVRNVPKDWEGHLWVVGFSKTGVRVEARVGRDGVFRLDQLPAGEFGFKVGHDAFEDPEVPRGEVSQEAWDKPADPWKHAKRVQVQPGRVVRDIELELPAMSGKQ